MKKQQPKVRVNTRLPEDVIHRWHLFAAKNKLGKEEGLEEIINRGTKRDKMQQIEARNQRKKDGLK